MKKTVVRYGEEYDALLAAGWTVVRLYWMRLAGGEVELAVLVND